MNTDRRSFLGGLAAAVAGLMLPRCDTPPASPATIPAPPQRVALPSEPAPNCIVREEVFDASLGYCTGYIEYSMYLPTTVYPPPRYDL